MANGNNNTDALEALVENVIRESIESHCPRGKWITGPNTLAISIKSGVLKALAAPAEGGREEAVELTKCCGREECGGECGNEWRGTEWVRKATPPAASVALSGEQREWLEYAVAHMLDDGEPEDKTCAAVLQTLIDSAGGAKGMRDAYEGAREDLLDWKGRAQRAERTLRGLGYTGIDASEAPQPGEGDGAVADALMVVNDAANDARHAGDYAKANALVRARVTLYRASARPAATAVVPESSTLAEWVIAALGDLPDAYADITVEKMAAALEENRKAAPAAPKGGVVDEAMVERACEARWSSWSNPNLRTDEARDEMRQILIAALATGEQP